MFSGNEFDLSFVAEKFGDSVGVLLFSCIVALAATLARTFAKGRWSWLVNMVMFHGSIVVYWKQYCGKPVPFYGMQTVHDALCYGDGRDPTDGSPLWWSSPERWIWAFGAVIGVTVNVIPKYMSGEEATRHMYHVKKATMNPLLFHIISGIMTLLASGSVMLYWDYQGHDWAPSKTTMKIVFFCDILHQLGINRMLRNHDGIWFLRCGNQASAVGKMIVMLNCSGYSQIDLMFFASCGFLGTRVWCSLMFMVNYAGFSAPTLALEYWYSIGVMLAHMTVFFRGWKLYGLVWWLCVVNSSAFYFHQLWKPWLEYRTQFVYLGICLTVLVCSLPNKLGMLVTLGFAYTGFQIPHFKREPILKDVQSMMNVFKEKDSSLKESGNDSAGKASAGDEDDDMEMEAIQKSFQAVVQSRQSVAVSRFFTGKKIL